MQIAKVTFDAMAFNITRALQREQWFEWSAQQAQEWIEARVAERGYNSNESRILALNIMNVFLAQREG